MAYKADEVQEVILSRLAGGESLRSICRSDGMPNRSTVIRWLDADSAFATKYTRAKDIGFDERAEKLAEDLDDEEDVQRAKLKFEYARWYLSKLAPKKYGDKIGLTDGDGGPLQVVIQKFEAE